MSDGKDGSGQMLKIQIAVALIGLFGSLGGAWIASGTKFERELEARGEEIRALEKSLGDARKSLEEQQVKLEKVSGEVDMAKKAVGEIAAKAGEIVWGKLKSSWSVGGGAAPSQK
jgi:hypothetical protein